MTERPLVTYSALAAGTELVNARYRILEKVGDGAAASVYRALDVVGGRTVALKILDPFRGADPVGRTRFEREFEILSRLCHTGIAQCFSRERDLDLDLLVLELVEGETLARRMARGRLGIAEAIHFAAQILNALDACHRSGILHRDLKPANVILHPERGAVILDFGIAWFNGAASLTQTGTVIGSPQYLAPEALSSSLQDARADLYAVGAILFEMLTARPLYLCESVAELANAHRSTTPPSVFSLRPEAGSDLSAIVERAIRVRPEERFATALEMRSALESGRALVGRRLENRLPCSSCRTSLVVDVPFCPGCGRPVAWQLDRGPYAVQLHVVPDANAAMRWLTKRHRSAFAAPVPLTRRRLDFPPVPLAVGASEAAAEQLASEARDAGCHAETVWTRALTGSRLRAPSASAFEVTVATLLHFTVVMGLAWALHAVGVDWMSLLFVPPAVSCAGMVLAIVYVRRPLLRCVESAAASADEASAEVRRGLGMLKGDRARHLAASAVARAAPVLIGDIVGLSEGAQGDVLGHLSEAIERAAEVDLHGQALLERPRARLALEIAALKAKTERAEVGADAELEAKERERDQLADVSIAYDLSARRALEACEAISAALLTRTLIDDVDRHQEAL